MADATKMIRVWPNAHKGLDRLCELLAKEKGLRYVSYTDAATVAIVEAIENHARDERILRNVQSEMKKLKGKG